MKNANKKVFKPKNPFTLLHQIKRSAGRHGKSNKALRRADNSKKHDSSGYYPILIH